MKKNSDGLEYAINKSDIVGLVRKAWSKSFAWIETNRQAILKRGWGPRKLNFNALCHPEVLTSKPGYCTKKKGIDALDSQVAPDELSLSEGLVGSLVDKIYVHKAKEAENSGSNAVEWMRKQKATAEENFRSHNKGITAGLLAAAGRYHLSEDIHDCEQERVIARANWVQQKAQEKRRIWRSVK